MDLTQVQGYYGLRALVTPTNTLATNDIQVGIGNTALNISGSDQVYACRAVFAAGSIFNFDVNTGTTSLATTFVAGTAQVETATAVGTITATTANIGVVVTAAALTGSPKTVTVAVVKDDTAETWAGKVRTALNADADVISVFSVGPTSGTTANITLTRKPTQTLYAGTVEVPIYPANDSTLNIALNAGASGATTAGTSTNTTSGVLTSGVKVYDADGKNIEGDNIETIDTVQGIHIQVESGKVTMSENTGEYSNRILTGTFMEMAASGISTLNTISLSATLPANVTVTVVGYA
jgi:hypothetical protein